MDARVSTETPAFWPLILNVCRRQWAEVFGESIVNMVRTSPEYKRIQSENIGYKELLELESDSEFLNAIYQRMLNRPLDEHGRFHYGLRLQGGTLREVIISELKNSEEYKQALL